MAMQIIRSIRGLERWTPNQLNRLSKTRIHVIALPEHCMWVEFTQPPIPEIPIPGESGCRGRSDSIRCSEKASILDENTLHL